MTVTLYAGRRFRSRYRRRSGSGALIGVAVGAIAVSGLGAKAAVSSHARTAPAVHAPAIVTGTGETRTGNAALGMTLAGAFGWGGGSQWTCLYDLWERESGWQNDIANPQSGAFGIAQALGHGISGTATVVAVVRYPDGSAASDVTVNEYPSLAANSGDPRAQITWGLAYIQGTYGTPCGAWAHEEADSWY